MSDDIRNEMGEDYQGNRIPQADIPQVEMPEGIGEPPKGGAPKRQRKSGGAWKMWGAAAGVVALVIAGNLIVGNLGDKSQLEGEATSESQTESGSGEAKQSSSNVKKADEVAEFSSKPDTLEDELLAVGMRYRPSGSDEHKEQWNIVQKDAFADDPGDDWQFVAGVVEAAQAITEPDDMGDSSLVEARELAEGAAGEDKAKKEFSDLLEDLESGRYADARRSSYYDDVTAQQQSVQSSSSSSHHGGGVTTGGFTADDMLGDAANEGEFNTGSGSSNGEFDFGSLLGGSKERAEADAEAPQSSSTGTTSSTATPYGGGMVAETETYAPIDEPGFLSVSTSPVSTLSADVDTASYTNFRRMVKEGYTKDEIYDDSVRVEEWINYFDYGYDAPDEGELFGVTRHLGICPWNNDTQLLTLGFSTDPNAAAPKGGKNVVFLVDVSGSMSSYDKLPMLQEAMTNLADRLDSEDTISLVTYANDGKVVFDGKMGNDKEEIKSAIRSLSAEGGTNGGEGLRWAYETAKKHFRENGVNRIILCSDGDMNLGMSTTGELQDYVDDRRDEGIYLSVLGFGTGNYHDQNMEAIADHGNGSYYYIDCLEEADRVLGSELASTMNPLADDVKIQVEFNPANVKAYRLIGYVNRTLAAEDFRNDAKDGGEVGAGQAFTVAYEIVPVDSKKDDVDEVELRYGEKDSKADPEHPELESITCMIGGKEYEKFDPEVVSYEIEFGKDEAMPAIPELKNLPEGWEVLSAKSSQGGDGTVTNNISIGNDSAARQYVFKYVRK